MSIAAVANGSASYASDRLTGCSVTINTTGACLIEVTCIYYDYWYPFVFRDSEGLTWNWLTLQPIGGSGYERIRKAYAYVPVPSASRTSHTFYLNSCEYGTLFVKAYSGNNLRYGSEAGNSGSAITSLSTGSVTPAAVDALVTTALGWNQAITALGLSGGGLAIFDQIALSGGVHYGGGVGDEIQTGSAVARNPAWSWTNAAKVAGLTACYYEQSIPTPVRISQVITEGLSTQAKAAGERVSQVIVEGLSTQVKALGIRISQVVVETITVQSGARVTSAGVEIISATTPAARATSAGAEIVSTTTPAARVTMAGVEVIWSPETPPPPVGGGERVCLWIDDWFV